MNYFTSMYSPTLGVMRGQQVEQGLAQAELEGEQLRDREAAKRAYGKMGSGKYFSGFEGVRGAERRWKQRWLRPIHYNAVLG